MVWTGSKVVIDYIKNYAQRFKTFITNRVQQIRQNTDVHQWCYVPTRENTADGASRGLNSARVHTGSSGFKDRHSYGRMRTIGLVLRLMKWRYLQMTLN